MHAAHPLGVKYVHPETTTAMVSEQRTPTSVRIPLTGQIVDADGCSTGESDGDTIHVAVDQCPNTAPGAEVDSQGCPVDDSDGDGIFKQQR